VYTQCSKCETVFKLTAVVLRAAGGQVRCGKCGEVFNALARLAEDSSAFETGESPLDLEARADSILESVVALQVAEAAPQDFDEFAPPGVEIAHLQILDLNDEDLSDAPAATAEPTERSLEFTLPPGELDRIFIESKKREPEPEPVPVPQVELPPHPESAIVTDRPVRNGVSGFEVAEDVRREMLAGLDHDAHTVSLVLKSPRRPPILWLTAAFVSTLVLITQIVHQNREWFVAHGPFGATMRALYSSLGAPMPSSANLSAYQLRQWGVTGEPDANGTLRVRASILNVAAQLQPYPLLRVTLANRFGSHIGARDFEPSEYLGKPTARLLAPGERVDATLDILDPGKNAEGFEIDVCLRQPDQKISCASDVAPQTKL
jgi:predicted Zn finger-like uncharacterized protein